MPRYEYKVVPAPNKGVKAKGVKGAEARFSHALQELMNELAGYGWEYQRAETLPSIERSGLASSTTEWRNMLVFRRLRENDADAFAPELLPPPKPMRLRLEDTPDEQHADGNGKATDGDAKSYSAYGADSDEADHKEAAAKDPDSVTAKFKEVAASLKPDPVAEDDAKKST